MARYRQAQLKSGEQAGLWPPTPSAAVAPTSGECSARAGHLRLLQNEIVKTITFDNGKEFADHEQIADKRGCQCFFAKPYHRWERGANENTNASFDSTSRKNVLRQYYSKPDCHGPKPFESHAAEMLGLPTARDGIWCTSAAQRSLVPCHA